MSDIATAPTEPTADEIRAGVTAAFVAEGYVDEAGKPANEPMREALYEVIVDAPRVEALDERGSKAIRKGDLVSMVFPELPGAEDWPGTDNPRLAEKVFKDVRVKIWAACVDAPTGAIQRRIGERMGDGFVLCRTKITDDSVDAVYVTADRACISEDLTGSYLRKIDRDSVDYRKVVEMLVHRQPDDARKYRAELDSGVKRSLRAAVTQVDLVIAAVENDGGANADAADAEAGE